MGIREGPFYKNKFDEQGIKPGDINVLEDLSRLPFTVKNDLRDNYPSDSARFPFPRWSVSMLPPEQQESRLPGPIRPTTWSNGPNAWPATFTPQGSVQATSARMLTGWGFSRAAWASIKAQPASVLPSSRSLQGRQNGRSLSCRISVSPCSSLRPRTH